MGSDQATKVRRRIETTIIPVDARDQQRAGRTYVSATSVILGVEHGLDYGAVVSKLIRFLWQRLANPTASKEAIASAVGWWESWTGSAVKFASKGYI